MGSFGQNIQWWDPKVMQTPLFSTVIVIVVVFYPTTCFFTLGLVLGLPWEMWSTNKQLHTGVHRFHHCTFPFNAWNIKREIDRSSQCTTWRVLGWNNWNASSERRQPTNITLQVTFRYFISNLYIMYLCIYIYVYIHIYFITPACLCEYSI